MKKLWILSLLVLGACGSLNEKTETPAAPVETYALPTSLDEALASPFRTPANRERDVHRHPKETLNFFGIQPNMTVIEVSPGAGWYTEILAPFLAPQGRYVAAAVPVSVYAGGRKFLEGVGARPELQGKITVTDFAPPAQVEIAEPGSADMVLTFRNVHNWMAADGAPAAFDAFYKALKPGGILGVVEHRENPRKKEDPKAKNGYVSEQQVIRLARKAGFRLVNRSEINANPKDTKDHPKGVWNLPPTYRDGDQDREKYAAIGESDRMTLKFVKPAAKR